MGKSNLSTALIIGGLGIGAYLIWKKGGIADKVGEGIQSITDGAGEIAQTITDGAGTVAQAVTDSGIGSNGGVASSVGLTNMIKSTPDNITKAADNIGSVGGSIVESIGSAITGDKSYKWTGFKWPW